MAECISRAGDNTPDLIIDTSTLIVNFDNQGNVTVQIQIITKSPNLDCRATCLTTLFSAIHFSGFLDSDEPRQLMGTLYYEHNLTLRGLIC